MPAWSSPASSSKFSKLASSQETGVASTSSFNDRKAKSHHRRRSSISIGVPAAGPLPDQKRSYLTVDSLPPIPGTPTTHMSMSRSPSPALGGGGWSSPGLHTPSGPPSPASGTFVAPESWNAGRVGSSTLHPPPATSRNRSFFSRHIRKISSSLPQFRPDPRAFSQKEKPNHGQWSPHGFKPVLIMKNILSRMSRKLKLRLLLALVILGLVLIWNFSPLSYYVRRSEVLGGGKKFVIVLGANVGGGVMDWKGAREWAIERDSVRNKKKYVARWGYELEIVDMRKRKRYAHEWREGWQKVDYMRQAMRKYPDAEWFWWLDLNTFIMEPSYSLQDHIFNNLEKHVYRDINEYNPLNISHPLTEKHLSDVDRSPVGDGNPESINLVLAQDCSGFNLGSFMMRRSDWSMQLLDVWWDPVAYEQRHMSWEHAEQDALEQLYTTQAWVRKHTAFLPQRKINSFPPGACADNGINERYHYDQKDRDFLMNMAGCEWGRDCWGEMYNYRELSYYLNRNPWERFKEDLIAVIWFKLTGQKVKL